MQMLDETKKPIPPKLKSTLKDVLAHLPQDLIKGVHLIVLQDEIRDPSVARQMPDAMSQ